MQMEPERRSNRQRTAETRAALIDAARALFVEKGYAETGTPEIVAAAKVTRGALYHHFADKADLFKAVIEQEAERIAEQIEAGSIDTTSPLEGFLSGADAYFSAMSEPGRTRLLLLDGPSVLGHAEMARIDSRTGGEELRKGLANALSDDSPLLALSTILSAGFDRAALAIAGGTDAKDYREAMRFLFTRLLQPCTQESNAE